MLAKCVNPLCSAPFRYLEAGRLFRVESDTANSGAEQPEYFWLCRTCSASMTLRLDEFSGVRIVGLRDPVCHAADPEELFLLDRHKGRVLNRISFFSSHRTRRRSKSTKGELIQV
jgi:hypothetical protein